jgi:capsular exopolysaccharide synthesis family protein
MHGQSLVPTPHGSRLSRLDEGPLALQYADYELVPPTRGVDVHAFWLMLVRHRVMMLAILLLSLAAGLASIWLVDPVYSATAAIQIDPQAPRILGTENITPEAGRTENDRALQTQVDLLSSRSTAQHVADKMRLESNPGFLREAGLVDEPSGPMRSAKVTTALQHALSVSSPRDTRIISLRFDSKDPALAAQAANTFAETFIADSLQRRLDTYAYSRNFLKSQLELTKARLEGSERGLVDYARSAGLVDAGNAAGGSGSIDERRSITTASLVDLNAAYSQAQANRMQAQNRWQQALAAPAMSLPEVLANPAVQNLSSQRAALQATLEQERQRRQDEHPAVIQARAQISELDRQIGAIAAGIRASIGNQYRVAAGHEAALRGNVNALKSATLAEQGKGVRYNILKREADTNRNLYNTLLQRYHDVSTQAANLTNTISFIDRAQMPSDPSYPRPALNMALAGLAGVVLALGAGFARARTDTKLHGPSDVERDFPAPLLGVVPLLKGDQDFVAALDDPSSPATEAHHAITLALDPVAGSADPSVLLLTSSSANEGKSMIAFKLSGNFAAAGKNVLVIDGDMRRGSLHLMLQIPNRAGLANLLSQEGGAGLIATARFWESHGFSVLTRGRSATSPAELLAGSRFAELLDEAVRCFDSVIIDGPPVLGLADAPRLSSMADATIFVLEANRTSKDDAEAAVRRLRNSGAAQIGLVLTKYDRSKNPGAYDYGSCYDYGSDDAGPFEPEPDGADEQRILIA